MVESHVVTAQRGNAARLSWGTNVGNRDTRDFAAKPRCGCLDSAPCAALRLLFAA